MMIQTYPEDLLIVMILIITNFFLNIVKPNVQTILMETVMDTRVGTQPVRAVLRRIVMTVTG